MPSRSEAGLLFLRAGSLVAAALLIVGFPLPAAAVREQSTVVLVREEDVIAEDLYAVGDVIRIDGRVEGDVVAAAFSEVIVNGVVEGSVTAVAGVVGVTGEVGESVRAAARTVAISGEVGEDVLAAAWDVDLVESAQVGRDVVVWAWDADIGGRVGRGVEGQQRTTRVAADVGGDVDVAVGRLVVGEVADVAGDVIYTSEEEALVAEGAEIGGSLIHQTPLPPNVRVQAIWLLLRVLALLGTMAIGLALLWALPERSEQAARVVRDRPLAALAWGAGILAIAPALAVVSGLMVGLSPPRAGLPLLLVLLPLLLAAFSLLFFALLGAAVPVASAIGIRLAPSRSIYAAFLVGFLLLAAASLVPFLGIAVLAAGAAAGLGGWLLAGEP